MKVHALNAFYMCERWGGRPADDLLGDPLEFALNTFVLQVGSQHEYEKAEKRKEEQTQENQANAWKNNPNKWKQQNS